MKPGVIIVDDDPDLRELLVEQLRPRGYLVEALGRPAEVLQRLSDHDVGVVLTDLKMPGQTGTELCREIVKLRPDVPVIVMTAFGSMDTAVEAIRAGAYDFLTKPFDIEALGVALDRALRHRELTGEVKKLRRVTGSEPGFEGLVGTSPAMQRLYDFIERVADSGASILISGESGSGKELVAAALHRRSRRRDGPFVALNCAALPENLLESELFGHAKGAFTDARSARLGLMREAAGGTVFLDEIGDLSPQMQPKLLRALQERRIRPVGGDAEVTLDVRVIAATHKPLRDEVDAGRFRADLFYRLAVITIDVPPLRERGDDVLLLWEVLAEQIAHREGRAPPTLTDEVAALFCSYPWPGNVRELKNCTERCVALGGDVVGIEHVPAELARFAHGSSPVNVIPQTPFLSLFELERRHILRVLKSVGGNKSQAARVLGIDRKTLHAKLSRFGE